MIIPNKCKTCINRNSEKCPLNKKSKKPCELIEDEAVDQAEATEKESLMNKSAQFVQNATAATKRITGELFRKMLMNAGASIKKNAEKINDLNVFPVPDGDTGSNMSMTIGSAVNDLKKTEKAEVGDLANLTASAMLRGARGNSGVILSLLFRGISKELHIVNDWINLCRVEVVRLVHHTIEVCHAISCLHGEEFRELVTISEELREVTFLQVHHLITLIVKHNSCRDSIHT